MPTLAPADKLPDGAGSVGEDEEVVFGGVVDRAEVDKILSSGMLIFALIMSNWDEWAFDVPASKMESSYWKLANEFERCRRSCQFRLLEYV